MKKFALIRSFLVLSALAVPFGILSFGNAKSADAVTKTTTPVVLELFTSQSCSSCPPADKVLGDLAASNENIIALSCNVTYWNHLHWKDTLSSEYCTQRQRDYVRSLKSRGSYTPQIVINGQHEMVGSRGASIKRTITSAAPIKEVFILREEGIKKIETTEGYITRANNEYRFELPALESGEYYPVLIAYQDTQSQAIPSGENRGRTVTYTNPFRQAIAFDKWDGSQKTLDYSAMDLPAASGFALLVHEGSSTGKIVAAGKIQIVQQ